MKMVRVMVASVLAAVLGATLAAQPAQAGTVVDYCKGTRQWSGNLWDDYGHTGGRLEYWTASDGRKCAMLYDVADGAHYMRVQIDKLEQGFELGTAKDEGTYEYYAGGVQVTGDNSRCYQVSGLLKLNGNYLRRVKSFGTCP